MDAKLSKVPERGLRAKLSGRGALCLPAKKAPSCSASMREPCNPSEKNK